MLAAGLQHTQTLCPILVTIPGKPQPHHSRSPHWETAFKRTGRDATNHWVLQEGMSFRKGLDVNLSWSVVLNG